MRTAHDLPHIESPLRAVRTLQLLVERAIRALGGSHVEPGQVACYFCPTFFHDEIYMATSSLRRAGGSVMLTLPPLYLKETGLTVGSVVSLDIRGEVLRITPARKRLTLKEIVSGTPKEAAALRAEGWEVLEPAGRER